MMTFETPNKEVLEAMVRLLPNVHFQRFLDWLDESLKQYTQKMIDVGEPVVRGHCQTLTELLDYVRGAQESLTKFSSAG